MIDFACVLVIALAVAPPAPPFVAATLPQQREVFHDTNARGDLCAAGLDYKMIFGAEGARYVPRLGAAAPHSTELRFALDGLPAAAPMRDGDRVTLDRGAIVEVYDLAVDHVEQSFVLRAPLAASELRVRVLSDATYAGRAADGLRFDAQGLGTIAYGDATIRDARGVTTAMPVRFESGAIVIPLPARARYPLVVDPLVTTITVDGGIDQMEAPDVAYHVTAQEFQVSYTRIFSSQDRDVLAARYTKQGFYVDTIGLDVTEEDSRTPRVACSGTAFMTTWEDVDHTGIGDDGSIQARARGALADSISAKFRVSSLFNDYPSHPAIGGGASNGSFLVTWQELGAVSGFRVMGRIATSGGNTSGTFQIDATDDCLAPEVSAATNGAGLWLVAYTRKVVGGPNVSDVYVRQVSTSATVVGNAIDVSPFSDVIAQHPAVATDGTNFCVVFDLTKVNGELDVWGHFVFAGANPTSDIVIANLSESETNSPAIHDLEQHQPTLSFDGARFTYAYEENAPGSLLTEVRAATIYGTNNPGPMFQEAHVLVAGGGVRNSRPRLASCGLSQPGKHFVSWTRESFANNDKDVLGAVWSSLAPGGTTVLQTGCGGPAEPRLVTQCIPALGNLCNVALLNFHAPVIAFGPPNVALGCPKSACQLGVSGTPYLVPVSATVFQFMIAALPSLVGTQLAMQGLDLQPPATATETCPIDAKHLFTTSDTLVFTIQ